MLDFDQANAFSDLIPQRPRSGGPRPLIPAAPPLQTPSQDASSAASAAASAANANRTQALTQPEVQGQVLQNQGRERDLQVPAGMSDATVAQARDRVIAARTLRDQLRRTDDLFRPYEGSTSLGEIIWSPGVQNFQDQAQSMMPMVRRLFRSPDASTTEQENAYYESLLPNWHATDVSNRRRIDQLNQMLDQIEGEYGSLLPAGERQPVLSGGRVGVPTAIDSNLGQSGESMGRVGNLPPMTDMERSQQSGSNQLDNSGGLYATEQDRERATQLASHATAMARAGASPEQINQWLAQQGLNPIDASAAQTINNYRRQRRSREFPGFSPNVIPTGRSDPNLVTGLANTPLGAAVIGGGDAITFGTLDNLTSNPERTRAGMELLREQHPLESALGEAAGSLIPGSQLERAASRVIRGLTREGALGARAAGEARTLGEMAVRPTSNAIYGAGYGAGSNDSDRLGGAFNGAWTSALGGEVGDRVTAGAGRALTGTRNAAVRALADRGVPLTIGDIASGGGVVGRTVSRIQNATESLPYIGDAIRARRADSREAFNRAAFDEALAPIGANTGGVIGEEGAELARAATGNAYSSALDNVQVGLDRPFDTALANIQRRASNLPPDLQGHFARFVKNRIEPALRGGQMTGSAYQALRQDIRQELSAISGQLGERDYGVVLRRTEAALSGLLRRQSPQTRGALRAADQAYRRARVVEGAIGRGVNNDPPGVFTPAQLGQEAKANANRFGGNAATTRRPFYQLQREAQSVLPSNLPNSGTADRAWVLQTFPAIAAGTAYQMGVVDPKTAALFAGLGLPYTRAGQRTFQKLLISRPDRVRQIGEAIIARRGVGAQLGAGAVNPLTDRTPSPSGR